MWLSCLLAFTSSACTLVIELIAGRIMAPYIGVSLYTWTSIIGVVLAGMSGGNFLGGVVADRFASRRTLGLIFLAGGVASLGILVITHAIEGLTFGLSFLPRIVLSIAAIFFLPSFILGMVSPLVVKLALADLEHSGHTVGTIYAASTVGSIVGTFVTGFWLISWLGTRSIVWLVAAVLLVTGLSIGAFHRRRRGLAIVAGVGVTAVALVAAGERGLPLSLAPASDGFRVLLLHVVVFGPPLIIAGGLRSRRLGAAAAASAIMTFAVVRVAWGAGQYAAPCDIESNYYCIKVLETSARGHPARMLMLDRLVHSYVVPDDPTALDYGYEQAYSNLTQVHAAGRSRLDTLFIGGGGYSFPRYVEAVYPASSIDVIEIDPAVIAVARERLGLPASSRIRSFNSDARMFLTEWTDPKQYDIVYGDAFNDLSIPYHLTTVEFNRIVAGRLKADGIYLTNIIDKFEGGEFLKAEVNALRAVFPDVYVFGRGEAFRPFDRNTYVVMASKQPLDRDGLTALTAGDDPDARTTLLAEERLKAYLTSGRALTLTDDFVPVDQLLANLFVERGK